MQNLCSTAVLIAFMRDITLVGRKVPTCSQVYSPPTTTIILQTKMLSSKMVSAKKLARTSPHCEFQPHMSVAVSSTFNTKGFTLGTLCLDISTTISFVIKKLCELYWLIPRSKSGLTFISTLVKLLNIVGTCSMTVMLEPTLELNLGEIAVIMEDFN